MVYSSFYFLELKEVQDCTEYRFEIFSFARVSPHAVVGPSPSEKKRKIMEDRPFTELFPSKNWHQLPPSKQSTSFIHTFIVATFI